MEECFWEQFDTTTVLSLSLSTAKIDAATSNWVGYDEIVLLTISSF